MSHKIHVAPRPFPIFFAVHLRGPSAAHWLNRDTGTQHDHSEGVWFVYRQHGVQVNIVIKVAPKLPPHNFLSQTEDEITAVLRASYPHARVLLPNQPFQTPAGKGTMDVDILQVFPTYAVELPGADHWQMPISVPIEDAVATYCDVPSSFCAFAHVAPEHLDHAVQTYQFDFQLCARCCADWDSHSYLNESCRWAARRVQVSLVRRTPVSTPQVASSWLNLQSGILSHCFQTFEHVIQPHAGIADVRAAERGGSGSSSWALAQLSVGLRLLASPEFSHVVGLHTAKMEIIFHRERSMEARRKKRTQLKQEYLREKRFCKKAGLREPEIPNYDVLTSNESDPEVTSLVWKYNHVVQLTNKCIANLWKSSTNEEDRQNALWLEDLLLKVHDVT